MVERPPLMDLVDWVEMHYFLKLTPWQKKLLRRLQDQADLKIAKRKLHG